MTYQDILPTSRLPEIWENFHRRLEQIDQLENKLDEHVKSFRRRIGCRLDQTPAHRRSHLRLFLTHQCEPTVWTLVIEGKLLVGLLDHASAIKVDKEGPWFTRGGGETQDATNKPRAHDVLPTIQEPGDGKDRIKVRSVGDIEEDPVEPTLFTHTFDKMEVTFQTVWQPETPPQAGSALTPPKKSRKRKSSETPPPMLSLNPKHLRLSQKTTITWNKEQSGDAHAFHLAYTPQEAPEPLKVHSVVATIVLHPTPGTAVYQPSPALAEKFFPKHSTGLDPRVVKRRKMALGEEDDTSTVPLHNDIYVPSHLTMNEILQCLLTYITDNKLQDEADKSLILCDKVLAGLLECDSLNFGDLQSTLLSKNLVTPADAEGDPILLTYIMKTTTSSHQEIPPNGSVVVVPEGHIQQVLSFDMDVNVPSFFHWRAREIMRRYKRREFEYTSSRTKGRYALVASRGHEELVKTKIGECISGQGYLEENAPVFLALAKSAPANSEARGAAQIDAKTCALVGRLDECTRHAQAAWELVEDCRTLFASYD
jgi:SWIB/MDM2 domain